VGSFFSKALKKLCGERIVDILYHVPIQSKVYSLCTSLKDFSSLKPDQSGKFWVRVRVKPSRHEGNSRKVSIFCQENDLCLELVFFNISKAALGKMFPLNQEIFISGELIQSHKSYTMTQPKRMYKNTNKVEELIYPLTKGIVLSAFSRILFESFQVFDKMPKNTDWLDEDLRLKFNWPCFYDFIHALHDPFQTFKENMRERLAFDELLAHQLSLLIVRKKFTISIEPLLVTGNLRTQAMAFLPYDLTQDQQHVLTELFEDLKKDKPMSRLLQGDVGSGKTIVAFLSMLDVVELGHQCAFLAPTEILAQQHFESLKPLAEKLGLTLGLFLGAHSKSQKNKNQEELKNGTIDIAIGTHALFQEGIEFKSLKYMIIDEQHRFGVEQRLSLRDKGDNPHMLMMTATPIPRTIVMVQYGDLDLSFLRNKPKDRKPIHTSLIAASKEKELIEGMKRVLEKGNQVYWVCPLIEESEHMDLADVTGRYLALKEIFGDQIALLHGRMKSAEKDEIMQKFQENTYKILVTTTVIEVGVNVPNATIMIIENAQRFGLSQLHQLRGRVGRGAEQSYCILMHSQGDFLKRLEIMRSCEDGFTLSEMDLKLRGRGDILGTQQSGFKGLRFLDQEKHQDLIPLALSYAKKLYEQKEEGKIEPLILLEIFKRKEDYRGI
jgi:ATP-dependent DNA helicase RecG